eukprot:GHVO01064005.1.p1 GENE.GHVO01064005.1~~GHVO01064005.1.p1  ORF type:complete len:241 (-),score=41.78 GHVO01064005.1:141-863(-)
MQKEICQDRCLDKLHWRLQMEFDTFPKMVIEDPDESGTTECASLEDDLLPPSDLAALPDLVEPTEALERLVCHLLGRSKLTGFLGVICARRGLDGDADCAELPAVAVAAPVCGNVPCPTLFWLLEPTIKKKLSCLESQGYVTVIEAMISGSVSLQRSMIKDHLHFIKRRWKYMTSSMRDAINPRQLECLTDRGIGGMSNFTAVRCLHMHYAIHIIEEEGTTVGRIVDEFLDQNSGCCDHH